MRFYRNIFLLTLTLTSALIACKKNTAVKSNNTDSTGTAPTVTIHPDDEPPVDTSTPNINITWDTASIKISHDVYYAEYGRICRVNANTLLLTYHCGGVTDYWNNIALRRSTDNGNTWSAAQILLADNVPGYYGFSDPDILLLKNGWLMLAFVGRGNPDDNTHDNVQICISKDGGLTWSTPKIIALGRSWEPGMVQLPDGDIEMFYSSEAKWWPSSSPQQDILFIHSTDNGNTWTFPVEVADASGDRDGMPVPVLLNDNKGIVFSIESVNNFNSPWLMWSSTAARWNYAGDGTTQNGRRWLVTNNTVFGGAPFLVQLSTGEILLSFQAADGRNIGSDWQKSTMLIYAGNTVAKNFTRLNTEPWPGLPVNEGAYYSSIFLKDDSTAVLVTSRNFPDGHSEVWWKEGHITR